jgi:NAD(P)-dependent dehydrogenase (short-subunit alcohol dehydrogenase family)
MANILLTGASRGIGAAAFTTLTAAGHHVIGQSTRGGGGFLAADFAEPRVADRLWSEALAAAGGRIDVVVNNAGVFEDADINDADEFERIWQRSLAINLQSVADLCRHAVLHFRQQGGGRIINVASRAGHRGDAPANWHYAAAKGGLLAMTKTLARAYSGENILCYAIAPGFVLTPMAEDYLAGPNGDRIRGEIPLGRVAEACEIAETIRWLASEAPPSLTGATLDVNGASYVR